MRIGFIGIGLMGRGMAGNLQKAGHQLVVYNRSKDPAAELLRGGAIWAETPRSLAEQVELVFTSLPTPADVESVGFGPDGLAAGFRQGAAWFDLTTNAVDVVRRIQSKLQAQNIAFLDAPVSGGPAGAATGKLAIWASGDKTVFDRFKPVLDAMADQPRYVGEIGAGSIAKLVHNMANVAINAVMGEVLTMGVKAGLDPLQLWETIRTGGAGRMRCFDGVSGRFLQGRLDPPNFALGLVQKDIDLALQLGRQTSVPMRLCNLVAQDVAEAVNRGWSGRDAQAFLLLQQERAGVPPFALKEEEVKAVVART